MRVLTMIEHFMLTRRLEDDLATIARIKDPHQQNHLTLPPRHKGKALKQMHILFVFQ